MNEEDLADEELVLPADTEEAEDIEETVDETEETIDEDPLKLELDKVQKKGRTKVEKLLYTKKRVENELKELGIDDDPIGEDEEDRPLTVREFKKIQEQSATKSALDLVGGVQNEVERELLTYHLENTIKSSGNPQEDFDLARTLVNAVKNKQIMEEANRKPNAKTHSSASGAPPKKNAPQDELTSEELSFMKPPFSLTKEQILAARK